MNGPTYPVDSNDRDNPTRSDVVSATIAQDSVLSAIEDDLVKSVQDRLKVQERDLRTVYRPLVRNVAARVASQRDVINELGGTLVDRLQTRLATQGATLQNLPTGSPINSPQRPPLTRPSPPVSPPPPEPPPVVAPQNTQASPPVVIAPPPGNPCSYPPSSTAPPGYLYGQNFNLSGPGGRVIVQGFIYPDGSVRYFLDDPTGCTVQPSSPPTPPPGVSPPFPVSPPPPAPSMTCAAEPAPVTNRSILPWVWKPYYWFSFVCRVGCPIELYQSVTYTRRAPDTPGIMNGPYETPPTAEFIQQTIESSGCLQTDDTPPPPAPPPPSTVSPPSTGSPPPSTGSPPPPASPPPVTLGSVPAPGACWGSGNVCNTVDEVIRALEPPGPSRGERFERGAEQLINVVSAPFLYVGSKIAGWLSGASQDEQEEFRNTSRQNIATAILGTGYASTVLSGLPAACVPRSDVLLSLAPSLIASNIASRTSGLPLDYLTQSLTYTLQYANPQYIPEQSALDNQYLANQLSREEWECMTKANGNHPLPFFRSILSSQVRPTPLDFITLWRRGKLNNDRLREEMRRSGILSNTYTEQFKELTQFIPPPSDLIRFAVKEVFDPNDPDKPDTMREYLENDGLRELFAAQGMGPFTITTEQGSTRTYDSGYMYWHAHYDDPSPTQAYEFVHRLRPNRVKNYPMRRANGEVVYPKPFGVDELFRLLKDKDYTPRFRDRLAAIAFRPLGRIDVKNLYKRGGFGTPLGLKGMDVKDIQNPKAIGVAEIELYERFLDMGYSEPDAQLEVYDAAAAYDSSRNAKGKAKAVAMVCRMLGVGSINRFQARDKLAAILGDDDEAFKAVLECEATHALNDMKAAVAGVRRAFTSGEIGEAEARRRLTRVGVDADRIKQYLTTWGYYLQVRTREVTATQILDWFKQRIVDKPTAKERLVNLKYQPDDAERMLRIAELGELAKSAKEQERLARYRDAARRREESRHRRELKEQESLQQKVMARRLSAKSEKNMASWWKEGLIEPNEIQAALLLKGWEPVDVTRWLTANRPR